MGITVSYIAYLLKWLAKTSMGTSNTEHNALAEWKYQNKNFDNPWCMTVSYQASCTVTLLLHFLVRRRCVSYFQLFDERGLCSWVTSSGSECQTELATLPFICRLFHSTAMSHFYLDTEQDTCSWWYLIQGKALFSRSRCPTNIAVIPFLAIGCAPLYSFIKCMSNLIGLCSSQHGVNI